MDQKVLAEDSATLIASGAAAGTVGSIYLPSAPGSATDTYREIGRVLVERLLLDGAEKGVTIQDIAALASPYKTIDGRSPKFMRDIVVDLALCLRAKYAVK